MKKLYFLFGFMLINLLALAQPNFTYNDMPNIGDNDSLYHNPIYSPTENLDEDTGNNYSWDYSSLTFNNIFWAVDSFRVRTNPVSDPFVDATIEYYHQEATGNNLDLYSFSNNTLFTHRTGSTTTGTAFVPPIASIEFPIAFNEASEVVAPLLFGTTPIGERTTNTSYDGFGSINLPGNQNMDNVFRIKSVVRDSTFSTGFTVVYTSYLWYVQGGDIPLLKISKTDISGGSGTIYNVYARRFTSVSTGMEEISDPSFSIYPNPASKELRFTEKMAGVEYSIYSLSRKVIMSGLIEENNKLKIQSLSPGTYFLRLGDGRVQRFVKE